MQNGRHFIINEEIHSYELQSFANHVRKSFLVGGMLFSDGVPAHLDSIFDLQWTPPTDRSYLSLILKKLKKE